jgi:hypothetical protein
VRRQGITASGLGLAVYREFGRPADHPGMVFFPDQGLAGASGHAARAARGSVMIWIQERDVRAEHARPATAGVPVTPEPVTEPSCTPKASIAPR